MGCRSYILNKNELSRTAPMAQLVERMTSNHEVRGSNPRGSILISFCCCSFSVVLLFTVSLPSLRPFLTHFLAFQPIIEFADQPIPRPLSALTIHPFPSIPLSKASHISEAT